MSVVLCIDVLKLTCKYDRVRVLTVMRARELGSGAWTGSGSESPLSFHRIRTRSAGWETLSASFRTTNQTGPEVKVESIETKRTTNET